MISAIITIYKLAINKDVVMVAKSATRGADRREFLRLAMRAAVYTYKVAHV